MSEIKPIYHAFRLQPLSALIKLPTAASGGRAALMRLAKNDIIKQINDAGVLSDNVLEYKTFDDSSAAKQWMDEIKSRK